MSKIRDAPSKSVLYHYSNLCFWKDCAEFLAAGIYAIVKFVSTLGFALFVVDFIGRRRSLMTGICLQIVTLAYVGGYLDGTQDISASQIVHSSAASNAATGAIVAIYLHAVAWRIGWFSIPYLMGSEIFPDKDPFIQYASCYDVSLGLLLRFFACHA